MLITCLRVVIAVAMLGSAVALAYQPQGRVMTHTDQDLLRSYVGQVPRKCCLWGRRWGCDAKNFNQSGCVQVNQQFPQCWPMPSKSMHCTAATCQNAGTEDACNVDIRSVGLNICRPTGMRTTVGCPPNFWQCHVEMKRHDSPSAPKVDVLVCQSSGSTICPFNHSRCN